MKRLLCRWKTAVLFLVVLDGGCTHRGRGRDGAAPSESGVEQPVDRDATSPDGTVSLDISITVPETPPSNVDDATATFADGHTLRECSKPTGCWIPMPFADAVAPRAGHSAVWDGSAMLIWGGAPTSLVQGNFNDGSRFSPAASSWEALPQLGALSARSGHLAVWTGQHMWIWGGGDENGDTEQARQGILYEPRLRLWTISHANWVPEGRTSATALWTGKQVAVWGGSARTPPGFLSDGALYDPQADAWTAISAADAPVGRFGHVAVWTGDRMLIWGGQGATGAELSGGNYDPLADRWYPISNIGAPSLRNGVAVWTGREMLVWNGAKGGRYDPASDTWRSISSVGAPPARSIPTTVWTGNRMIVWGGYLAGTYFQDGGVYDPETDTWIALAIDGAPEPRRFHSALWTGESMLIWGGRNASGALNSGAELIPPS